MKIFTKAKNTPISLGAWVQTYVSKKQSFGKPRIEECNLVRWNELYVLKGSKIFALNLKWIFVFKVFR